MPSRDGSSVMTMPKLFASDQAQIVALRLVDDVVAGIVYGAHSYVVEPTVTCRFADVSIVPFPFAPRVNPTAMASSASPGGGRRSTASTMNDGLPCEP